MKAKGSKNSASLPSLHRASKKGGGSTQSHGVLPLPAARPRMPQPAFHEADDEFQHWHAAHEESKRPGAKRSPRLLDPIDTGVAGGGGGGPPGGAPVFRGGRPPVPGAGVGVEGSHYASATVTGLAEQSDAAVGVEALNARTNHTPKTCRGHPRKFHV